ncbi:MAG: CCA tRNA nucleotidyltransferase [Beijerinckiaceae bacterium]|nr:CCA tRNA nucleotidyltransferase [Beijerinckiaceae bacterium]
MSIVNRRITMTGPLADQGLHRLLALLSSEGDRALIVGGAVRNSLMGYPIGDIDIATTVRPERIIARAGVAGMRAIPTGFAHGTVTVIVDAQSYEVTTLREDIDTDGRHATVIFGDDFKKDAARRDFTMNALYADNSGFIHDYVGGLEDILYRRVKFIGDAKTRIQEDYLRILRFFRFSADYGEGKLDPDGLAAIIEQKEGLQTLSAERLKNELLKVLLARKTVPILTTMTHIGIFDLILQLPTNVNAIAGLLQRDPGADALLRLAAFCIHKPDDALILKSLLKLSNAETDRLTNIGTALMRLSATARPIAASTIRRMAFRLGRRTLTDALVIDAARRNSSIDPASLSAAGSAPVMSPFTGSMLLKRGVPQGRKIGEIIQRAEESWMAADFPSDAGQLNAFLNEAIKTLS